MYIKIMYQIWSSTESKSIKIEPFYYVAGPFFRDIYHPNGLSVTKLPGSKATGLSDPATAAPSYLTHHTHLVPQ
jgi:hypothetical protein